MQRLSLNGAWTLSKRDDPTPIPAHVPGCVHTDLLAAGLLEDPFYRDNEQRQLWVGETDWRYQRRFNVSADLLHHERVLLRCFGLDTIATLKLNGVEFGTAANMFRTWEYDIKRLLHEGENTLEIDFAAPMPYACRMDAEKGEMAGWVHPMRINSGAWIRKEPCNFGWDWGPKMITSGIWRAIELVAFDVARLHDVAITQTHGEQTVTVTVRLQVEQTAAGSLLAEVKILRQGEVVAHAQGPINGNADFALVIANPDLWYPHNMGGQPLYTVGVSLYDAQGGLLDTLSKRIGLRTLTLERQPDEWGESFYFACNGIPFFAKGANWIPSSPYPGQPQRADYERLIQASTAANMNMLRVWGGGYYEDDAFYDLCDEYGITIWQDFMFACGTYPAFDEAFMANVAAEARDNIRRIGHHACVALWCGNNEIEQGMPSSPGWQESMSWDDYSRLFDVLLADLVRELAPQTAYWPGSPHSPCGDRNDPLNPACGDTHLWAVWHGKEPFEWYRTRLDRFCSEFGFQSFPEPRVVDAFTEVQDRNITSYVMEHHQRSGIGNSTIIHYLLDWFRLPTAFDKTLWLSQILQGMAMKYAVEHWRRNMPRTMGALYWQLNDMWPAPSWASLDWQGNWKALHYMARRFFAPRLVSGLEDAQAQTLEIHVTSDLGDTRPAIVRYFVTTAAGQPLHEGEIAVTLNPRSTRCVEVIDLKPFVVDYSTRNLLVWLELWVDGAKASDNLVTLSRPKHLELVTPGIQAEVHMASDRQGEVTLQARAAALYLWLELAQAQFADGFFHLRPGEAHTVAFTVTAPCSVDEVQARLKIYSLVDTYAQTYRG